MLEYEISIPALKDLDKIERYITRKSSRAMAQHVERKLFEAFEELARLRPLGHKRSDLRQTGLLSYTVFNYVIVFRRQPHVVVLRIIHGARDLPRRL